jgi:uncharacterized protein
MSRSQPDESDARIPPEIAAEIQSRINEIERVEDVRIVLAVESGSRAWGFASLNSDYDVRFIYVRRTERYLAVSACRERDVIERPIVDEIDLNGWDLRKAIGLLRVSNPPLLEWLGSGIVYRECTQVPARLRALVPHYYSPHASFHHYLQMAKRTVHGYLRVDPVDRKKYFYALRPLLALRWIDRGLGAVPMEFQRLVEAVLQEPEVRAAVEDLLDEKRAGLEKDKAPRIRVIDDLIADELARLEAIADGVPRPVIDPRWGDDAFRQSLAELWGPSLLTSERE